MIITPHIKQFHTAKKIQNSAVLSLTLSTLVTRNMSNSVLLLVIQLANLSLLNH